MGKSINELVATGDWLECVTSDFEGEYLFKIRISSFYKVRKEELLQIHQKLPEIKSEDGVLWVLKIEVVNLTKKSFYSFIVRNSLILVDQDDFQFEMYQNYHLLDSEFGIYTGLNRFQSWTSDPNLQPKIKASGALACFLPDDDLASYYLSVKEKYM